MKSTPFFWSLLLPLAAFALAGTPSDCKRQRRVLHLVACRHRSKKIISSFSSKTFLKTSLPRNQ